jgi:NAD(P)-dependent dehydrogenase (short-subunit alcohol dehydrogenase family)
LFPITRGELQLPHAEGRFMSVLVTGGAGYIGSHMVLELLDAGEDVLVLDNLSTGFQCLQDGAPLIVGDVGDQTLGRRLLKCNATDAIIPFRGLDRRAGLGLRSARLLPRQHLQVQRALPARWRLSPAFHLLLDRGDVRHAVAKSRGRGCPARAHLALR